MTEKKTIGGYVVLKDDDSDLGTGASGSVYMAKHVTSGKVVAAKRMKLSLDPVYGEDHNRKYVFNEVKILKTLNHRNVIKLYNSERKGKYIYLFLELCQKGDLNKFIEKERVLTREVAFRFLVHISEALVYLHGHEPVIIHRDVKPDNLLVQGDDDQNYVIKITDFAFSKQDPNAAVSTAVGTQNWMAPEVRPDKDGRISYSIEADVFSAGLVFLAILDHEEGKFFIAFKVGGRALGDWMNVNQVAATEKPLPAIMKRSDDGHVVTAKGIILQMLSADPSDRCTMRQVRDSISLVYDAFVARSGARPRQPSVLASSSKTSAAQGAADVTERPKTGAAATASSDGADDVTVRPATAATAAVDGASASSDESSSVKPKKTGLLTRLKNLGMRQQPSASPAAGTSLQPDVKLEKLGKIRLPGRGAASLGFGQGKFLVGFEDDPKLYFYVFRTGGFELIWENAIPKEVKFDCAKHITPRGEFILQQYTKEVSLLNSSLEHIRTVPSPGWLICLLPGGERALVGNENSPSSDTEGLRLLVTSSSNPATIHHKLSVPKEGRYRGEDGVRACGREDGWLAVVVREKSTFDIYDASGRHVVRTTLPGDAASYPSCTQSCVLVPLYHQPRICVMTWSGDVTRILEHGELGLADDDCFSMSPVHEGRVHVWLALPGSHHEVHTYAIEEKLNEESHEEEHDD